MKEVRIYHNPRCSKSRATLALLRERGIEPQIVEYLKTPPDEDELALILGMLEMEPFALVRKTEEAFAALKLGDLKHDPKALIRQMVAHPILIERPIVVKGNRARIGRPPEKALEIL